MKLVLLLSILILTSCIFEKKTPYDKYLQCLKEYPENGNEIEIHKDVCFNRFSSEGFGLGITGFGDITLNTYQRYSEYKLTNETETIVKVKKIKLTVEKKNNTDETKRTEVILICEPKIILPNETKKVKCSYGSIDIATYNKKYNSIKEDERNAFWNINSSYHLNIKN